MKVLIVSGDFTTWGGMDRANYELAWHLAEHTGIKVELVAHSVAEPLASHINVIWRQVPRPFNSRNLGSRLLAQYGASAARLSAPEDRVIVNGGNCAWPDINWVHAVQHSWQRRVAQAPRHVQARQWLSRKIDLHAEKRALRMARVIIANSQQTQTRLVEELELSPHRIRTIYFGVDPMVFHPVTDEQKLALRRQIGLPEKRLAAVFVGALGYDRNKGFDVLFEAWRQLCADPSWDVDLMALGAGAEVLYWERKAAATGLSRRIRMMGFRQNIAEILQAADVFVHPAFYEAYGLSVHEALCCGIPALVTRSAGVAERYPSSLRDLVLDYPPSVSDLVHRLWQWRKERLAYHDRVQTFSSMLRQRTWTNMAQEFLGLTMPSLLDSSRNGHRRHITFPAEAQSALPAAVLNRTSSIL